MRIPTRQPLRVDWLTAAHILGSIYRTIPKWPRTRGVMVEWELDDGSRLVVYAPAWGVVPRGPDNLGGCRIFRVTPAQAA